MGSVRESFVKWRGRAPLLLALSVVALGVGLRNSERGADAAAVATTTSTALNTDKARCSINYSGTSPNITILGLCYFSADRTGITAYAGTDTDAGYLVAPNYYTAGVGVTGCLNTSGTVYYDVGPQSAVQSRAARALPVQSLAFRRTGVADQGGAGACNTLLGQLASGATNDISGVRFTTSSTGVGTANCLTTCSYAAAGAGIWPTFPTNSYPITTGSTACASVTVTLPAGVTSTTVIPSGDSFTFTASVASGNLPLFYVKYPGIENVSGAIIVSPTLSSQWGGFQLLPAPGGLTQSITVKNALKSGDWRYPSRTFAVSDVLLGCQIDNGGGPLYDNKFLGDGWTGVAAAPLRDCERAITQWAPFNQTTGAVVITVYPSLAAANGIPAGTAFNFSVGVSARYTAQGVAPTAWSSWQTAGPIGRGTNGLGVSYAVTFSTAAGWGTSLDELEIRCQDAQGIYQGKYFSVASEIAIAEDYQPPSEASCYSSTGLGWSPSSWVPGLVRLGSCVLKSLFVPSASSITALYAGGEAMTTKAPFSFAVTTYALVSGVATPIPAAVVAHEDDCLQLMGEGPTVGGSPLWDDQEACASVVASGTMTTFRTLMGVCFWIGFALMLFFSTKRVLVGVA